MAFIDLVTLRLQAGHGGAGAVAFRREKFVAYGGPYGGDGGAGGDITFVADRNIGTLIDLRYRKDVRAEDGQSGGTKRMTGRSGRGERIRVPVGTLIRDAQTLELIADMEHDGQELVLCRGGIGGLGNARFKTSTNQTPRHAQEGKPGEFREVTLELKLLADVGIIGYPSVGKSTLISVISNARPKIADYPFTTLTPNLGIVQWKPDQTLVVADIPGLIEGAHEGHGLGLQFLRHVERCRILVHVVECVELIEGMDDPGDRDPIRDFERINRELAAFSEALAARPDRPALCIVGEPTGMRPAIGHKGKAALVATCHGTAGHSSLAPRHVNALHLAAEFVAALRRIQSDYAGSALADDAYGIPYSTVHAGRMQGGTVLSLDAPVSGATEPLGCLLAEADGLAAWHGQDRSATDDADTIHDLARVLGGLSEEARGLFAALGTCAVAEIVERTGTSRSALYRAEKGLIAKIEIRDVSSSFAMEQIKYTTEMPLDYLVLDKGSDDKAA